MEATEKRDAALQRHGLRPEAITGLSVVDVPGQGPRIRVDQPGATQPLDISFNTAGQLAADLMRADEPEMSYQLSEVIEAART